MPTTDSTKDSGHRNENDVEVPTARVCGDAIFGPVRNFRLP
jgi:hypothetical protein